MGERGEGKGFFPRAGLQWTFTRSVHVFQGFRYVFRNVK
jgi:hypothetical protein